MEGQPAFWDVLDADDGIGFFHSDPSTAASRIPERIRAFFSAARSQSATDFPIPLFYEECFRAFPDLKSSLKAIKLIIEAE